ncbi:bifunctional diguanylate cyclase/phosphodiesterase [Aliidiomarina minuta]|uniref:Sensor protein FixL n=1 Tax=Aliidiomarina minuta TaxID=880057 RepID=A0A432W3S7_9GAMM|nr:GGDEF domain-containing phosphodiesterase [Aliidiomarina minuta]RUO23988.1 bifunctional diguanylate cyclase/phosphodiesterase [Aliidiomarina minuta]
MSEHQPQDFSASQLNAIINNLLDGVITIDQKGIICGFSKPAERMFGYQEHEVVGHNISMLMPQPYAREHDAYLDSYHQTGAKKIIGIGREVEAMRKDGSVFPIDLAVTQTETEMGRRYIGTVRDISLQRENAERIEYLSFHDRLTGLANRNSLTQALEQWLPKQRVTLLALNLDFFSRINVVFGHGIGDSLLQEAAKRLDRHRLAGSLLAKDLGDRFWLALPEEAYDGKPRAYFLSQIEKLLSVLRQPFMLESQEYYLTVSIGVFFAEPGQNSFDVLNGAETALQQSKEWGRDQYSVYQPRMTSSILRDYRLEVGLREAIKAGKGLECWLQSKVNADYRTTGAEALMRWRDEQGQMVSPEVFIPVAEHLGLIIELGDWMAAEVAKTIASLPADSTYRIALNVSPKQFLQPHFVLKMQRIFAEQGASLNALIIEITENLLLSRIEQVQSVMNELALLGVRFSIDDFGTGYSNLSRLQQLPVSELKIDRQFVQDAFRNEREAALFQAMLQMAKSMQLTTVAEGVETNQQANHIRDSGCDLQQGYYFSRPMPADQWLAEHKK